MPDTLKEYSQFKKPGNFTDIFLMEKTNYQKKLDDILSSLSSSGISAKPRLLLHACCAPCSSYVVEYLASYFDITIYYYNPNIHPNTEYFRRLNELKTFLGKIPQKVNLIETDYNPEEFFTATNTRVETELQTEPERGERCRRCYLFRMKKAYEYACENGFDWFTTTLSISPYKDAEKVNTIGSELELTAAQKNTSQADITQSAGVTSQPGVPNSTKFLTSDFKKKGGFLRSLELSKEYGLYRQDYCGCIFSKQNIEKSRKQDDN